MKPPRGLLIHRAVAMLQGRDDAVPAVTTDPVYISAEYIEAGITNGTLRAGCLANVTVTPPPEDWPERWRFLHDGNAHD